jgi:hypothetical protein
MIDRFLWILGMAAVLQLCACQEPAGVEGNPCGQDPCYPGPFEPPFVSGLTFPGPQAVTHDNRVYESENFLVFSDASSDETKELFASMAEQALGEVLEDFGFAGPAELGIADRASKITTYCSRYRQIDEIAFPFGFYLYGSDSQLYLAGGPYHDRYRENQKHEIVHVFTFLLGLTETNLPNFWFNEGLAEYVSGGAFDPITTVHQLDQWMAGEDHFNPISVRSWQDLPVPHARTGEYYPMFGLAVRYLLEPMGGGRTHLDVRAMVEDMVSGDPFETAFERRFGMSVDEYEAGFLTLIREFLPDHVSSRLPIP